MNLMILVAVLLAAAALFAKRVRTSPSWIATVTPLASIIGSGFLVVVPLLGHAEGLAAAPAMLGIVVTAYLVGGVIRHNIRHVEPRLAEQEPPTALLTLERLSEFALISAYLISVTFYLRILSAFLLEPFGSADVALERTLTSAVLIVIGGVGLSGGLGALERLEEISVNLKLAIITGLFVGLAIYDAADGMAALAEVRPAHALGPWTQFRVLAGMLLVVQGFETSRYLGATHDAGTRIRTMRIAQWVSGAVYLLFVVLALPLLPDLPARADETAIIELSAIVAPILPPLLVFAAVMSQLSAAVADTVGGGGLVAGASRGRLPARWSYVLIAAISLGLNWAAEIFDIIAFASRAFAVYYLFQCAEAAVVASTTWRRVGFAALGALLLMVAAFALPVG